MSINKLASGRWQVDIQAGGRFGRRVRKSFKTKREAEVFESQQKVKAAEGDFSAAVKDNRRLNDVIEDWYNLVGYEIKTGESRKTQLLRTAMALNNPAAKNAKAEDFIVYRKQRLESGITANSLNHELVYLKTVFNKLIKMGNWKFDNPYEKIEKLKFKSKELCYLEFEEIKRLLASMDAKNKDVRLIAEICLSTGCRWGEAETLEAKHFRAGKVEFIDTKNGENRFVPIDEALRNRVLEDRAGRGRLFVNSRDAFNNALDRASIVLPKGQKTHVLRHTFASHFMMAGGNILDLNKILGHKSLDMTMLYAHLSPKHLEVALEKNPLVLML